MKRIVLTVAAVVAAAGSGAAYWYGNQPKVTYYPSGEIRTSVEQKFYKENGTYSLYNRDGSISQKYTLADGMRIGQGTIHAGDITITANFVNGSLSGPLKFSSSKKIPELDNLQVNTSNKGFTIKFISDTANSKNSANDIIPASDIIINGKFSCNEDVVLDNMQTFLIDKNANTFNNFGKCLSFTDATLENELYKCDFKGGYQYPKFTADSKLECIAKGDGKQFLSAAFLNSGIENIGNVKTFINYSMNDKKFAFGVNDDKGVYNQLQSIKGLEEILPAIVNYTFSKQEAQDIVKLASEVLKDFVVSDSQLSINGKLISAVNGEFNFLNGFSNPWTTSFFGIENKLTSQVKITDKGGVLNIAYPISEKPLLSIGVQIDEVFKQKYQSFLELTMKEFSENPEDVAAEHLMAKLPEYSMAFSDVISSINALLMNNKGEKVLGALFSVKKGTDFMSISENLADAFTVKIISYKNNKPYKVISGDVENGFIADGNIIPAEDILEHLDKQALEDVVTQIENEYAQIQQVMKKNKYTSDPFIKHFSELFYNALQQYRTNETLEQIEQLAHNIQAVYADSENYGNLNNILAINLKAVPEEMITDNKGVVNALKGNVDIKSAHAFEGDNENLAFTVTFDNIPQESCVVIATTEWNTNSGMIAMGINKNVSNLYLNDSEAENNKQCNENGVLCISERVMDEVEADKACNKDSNTLYFKFQ